LGRRPDLIFGVPRSPRWAKVRADFLESHPRCECCGGSRLLNVHHVKPFHAFPNLELEPSNLITLCEGANGLNCHFWAGHCGNWAAWNERVRSFVRLFGGILSRRAGIPWAGNKPAANIELSPQTSGDQIATHSE